MSEFILIIKAMGYISLVIIILSIVIPLSFYMHEKRHTSKIYRQVEFSVGFILISIWGHTWSNDLEFLQMYWIIVIFFSIIGSIIVWNLKMKKRKIKSKSLTKKVRKR